MANIFHDNQQTTKGERDRQIKERADFEREVAKQEARTGITTSSEENINFYRKGE